MNLYSTSAKLTFYPVKFILHSLLLSTYQRFWNLTVLRFCTLGQSSMHHVSGGQTWPASTTPSLKASGSRSSDCGEGHLTPIFCSCSQRPSCAWQIAGPQLSSDSQPIKKRGVCPHVRPPSYLSQHHQYLPLKLTPRLPWQPRGLRLHVSNCTGDTGSILGWRTKIPPTPRQKININKNNIKSLQN